MCTSTEGGLRREGDDLYQLYPLPSRALTWFPFFLLVCDQEIIFESLICLNIYCTYVMVKKKDTAPLHVFLAIEWPMCGAPGYCDFHSSD